MRDRSKSSSGAAGAHTAATIHPRAAGGRLTPSGIVVIYVMLGSLWILFSTPLVAAVFKNPAEIEHLELLKGCAFVAVTGALLYALIRGKVAAVERSEHDLSDTLDGMVDAVIVVRPPDEVAYINQGAMRLLGVEAKDVPVTVRDLLSRWPFRSADGRAIPAEQRVTARALRGEAVHRFEGVLRRPNGEELVVAISAAPIRDEQTGQVRMAVLVLHDISEMKRLERLREDFVATAAHELKTPIAGIKGYAQRLLRWAPERPESREARASTVIVRQCDRLNRLVQELLEFSHQPFAMQEQLLRERLELGELVSDVLERMHAPPKYRLVVRRDQPAGVFADRDRIEQVLVNLLDNAIRYMPQGGEVAVSVGSREGKATVAVEDHGIGIPKERQARIFTPFFRPHAGTPYRFAAGLGIGLFISREIVARHGGRMWFSSEEGKGSKFCFSLPLASEGANGSQS